MPLDNTYRNYEIRLVKRIPEDFKSYLLTKDVEACNAFHKISIKGWTFGPHKLIENFVFNSLNIYLVKYGYDADSFYFHTSGIKILQALIAQGVYIYANNQKYHMEVTAFCATSQEMIGYEKIDDLIENVLRKRHREMETYDLSNIENEEEFTKRGILFGNILKVIPFKHIFDFSVSQVTKLNLSNNCLSQVSPLLVNALKWKLKSLDLSNNELQSLAKLYPLKELAIQELWLDGNPLCEDYRSPMSYIKAVKGLFPRLEELDGVSIPNNDLGIPLLKNYLVQPGAGTLIEKFISLYFPTYDSDNRDILIHAYHISALLTITTCGIGLQKDVHPVFSQHARNLTGARPKNEARKILIGSSNILNVLKAFPDTEHDLSTFEIDVLSHVPNWQTMFSINGVYKEMETCSDILKPRTKYYFFRRCFILVPTGNYQYAILNDMLFVRPAEVYETDRYAKRPASKLNELALIAPDEEDMMNMVNTFVRLSTLEADVARKRLKFHNWDIRKALLVFIDEYNNKLVPETDFRSDEFTSDEDFVD